MSFENIKDNYSKMALEDLIVYANNLNYLLPDAIPILQEELLKRGKKDEAINITRHLVSRKYLISDDDIFEYILKHRKNEVSEKQIDIKIIKDFNFDQSYIDLMKIKLKSRGKENLFLGLGLIILPLIFGIVVLAMGGFIGGIWVIFLIAIGVWKANKGYRQFKSRG